MLMMLLLLLMLLMLMLLLLLLLPLLLLLLLLMLSLLLLLLLFRDEKADAKRHSEEKRQLTGVCTQPPPKPPPFAPSYTIQFAVMEKGSIVPISTNEVFSTKTATLQVALDASVSNFKRIRRPDDSLYDGKSPGVSPGTSFCSCCSSEIMDFCSAGRGEERFASGWRLSSKADPDLWVHLLHQNCHPQHRAGVSPIIASPGTQTKDTSPVILYELVA